jgi:dihydroxyacid dehydratase/phosphogluconate dehydratase
MINAISEKTPHICSLSPGGTHHIQDLNRAGGISAVLKTLSTAGLDQCRLPDRHGQNHRRKYRRCPHL